jgi:hypothetical protein
VAGGRRAVFHTFHRAYYYAYKNIEEKKSKSGRG